MRRAVVVVVVGVAAVCWPAGAVQAAPLFDSARDCIREEVAASYSSTRRRADPGDYRVLGTRGTMRDAERARRIMRSLEIFGVFGKPGRLGPVLDDPYSIFIVPPGEFAPDVVGMTQPYCRVADTATRDGVMVVEGEPDVDLVRTLAHELFHSHAVDRSPAPPKAIVPGWFDEATATWGETQVVRDPDAERERDDNFIERPRLALDLWDGTDDEGEYIDHEYGAYRFVHHLEQQMGAPALYRLIRAVDQRIGEPRPEEHTDALAAELDERGITLGRELGAFWGAHLQATLGNGPMAPADTEFSAQANVLEEQDIRVPRLSARIVEIEAAPGVGRVTVTVDPPPEGGYVWLRDQEVVLDWSSRGGFQEFCVGGSEGLARPWPGVVRLAFTNGLHAADAGELEFGLTIEGDDEPCTGPDEDPCPSEHDSVRLPGRCPPPPPAFAPGAATHYHVYGKRFSIAYADAGQWVYLETQRARRSLGYLTGTRRARRAIARRIGARYRCAAQRLLRIDGVPDDHIVEPARRAVARRLRQAGAAIEDQNVELLLKRIRQAGRRYVELQTRVSICNTALIGGGAGSTRCDERGR